MAYQMKLITALIIALAPSLAQAHEVNPQALAQADRWFAQQAQANKPAGDHNTSAPVPALGSSMNSYLSSGSRTYYTTSGSYMVSRSGSSTFVIQTSRSR
jgi:hypothetical protein